MTLIRKEQSEDTNNTATIAFPASIQPIDSPQTEAIPQKTTSRSYRQDPSDQKSIEIDPVQALNIAPYQVVETRSGLIYAKKTQGGETFSQMDTNSEGRIIRYNPTEAEKRRLNREAVAVDIAKQKAELEKRRKRGKENEMQKRRELSRRTGSSAVPNSDHSNSTTKGK